MKRLKLLGVIAVCAALAPGAAASARGGGHGGGGHGAVADISEAAADFTVVGTSEAAASTAALVMSGPLAASMRPVVSIRPDVPSRPASMAVIFIMPGSRDVGLGRAQIRFSLLIWARPCRGGLARRDIFSITSS